MDKIVKDRKYGVIINRAGLRIERKAKDGFDRVGMGFTHLRMCVEASGKIDKEKGRISLIIQVKPMWENGLIALIVFSILFMSLLFSFGDLQEALPLGFGVLVSVSIVYGLLKFGLDEFKFDLEQDLKFLGNNSL